MKTRSTLLSDNATSPNIKLIKQHIRKKLKRRFADDLVVLLDVLNNDRKSSSNKKAKELTLVIEQIRAFVKEQ